MHFYLLETVCDLSDSIKSLLICTVVNFTVILVCELTAHSLISIC